MVGKLKRYAKEPLLCFFLLGMVVFGLHELLAGDASIQQDDPYRVDITSADYDAKRYGVKMSDDIPMITQERAYTSPIWYTPENSDK